MIPRAVAGAFLVFALLPCLLSAPPAEAPQFSLPGGAAPLKYALELTIDPRQPTFRGRVRIDVAIDGMTDVVWLHAKDLQVRRVAIVQEGRTIAARAKAESGEFLALTPARPLVQGPATITIEYTGRMDGRSPEGIYRRRVEGQWYAYSTFTPIEARRAFPGFDEPRFKTPWQISLRIRSTDRAFSNAPVASEASEPGGWKRIEFAETQPLPTELVAIGVGPFDVLESEGVRVIATKGRANEGQLAAEGAAEIVQRLAEYTGIPYPFGKLDLLTIPDLQFAAVETPGLITFRELGFLTTPDAATPNRRQAIEDLEAHEFAHQWFGNLVTQAGWQDTWLSEGFATWLGRKILGNESGAIEFRERLMRQDETGKARVVRQPARSRADASDIYNRVVYEKGAAALTMLEGWIGQERFRDALRKYLQGHAFANATTADFAAALPEPEAGAVIDAVLNTAGIPIVAAEIDCAGEPELNIATTLGPVPVCWRSDIGSGCQVIQTRVTVNLPEGSSCPAWFYLNSGGTGYYRTLWYRAPEAALPHLTSAERLTLAFDLRSTHAPGWRNLLEAMSKDANTAVAAAARDGLR